MPKDHRSSKKLWRHTHLPGLLSNVKYVGLWPWGKRKNERDPETGDVSQSLRPEEETKAWERHFPELAIIDPETFTTAQKLLADNAARNTRRHDEENGKFTADQHGLAADSPRHLLSGLIQCGHCSRRFYVGGTNGMYLFCPGYQQGVCPCQTTLRRDLAEKLILAEISRRILENPAWVEAVFDATMSCRRRLQSMLPNELRDTESALADVLRKIEHLVDSVEAGAIPLPKWRPGWRSGARRSASWRKSSTISEKWCETPPEPTVAWVREQLARLDEVLASPTPAAAFALQELVGGQIVVEEIRKEGRKRFFLRGKFSLEVGRLLTALGVDGPQASDMAVQCEEITIDFVPPDSLDSKAEEAKALWDQGLLCKDIAKTLGCSRAQVTKLLQHWAHKHEVELPNARVRRKEIEHRGSPPLYQQLAPRAYELHQQGRLIAEIAAELHCDINTITKALRFWCETNGVPWVDGRTRRKSLERKTRPKRKGEEDGEGGEPAAA